MKRYPKYKDSGIEWIGEIPEHWVVSKLKYSLDEIIGGGTPDTSNPSYWDDENGIPWVAISDITEQEILKKTSRKISVEGKESKGLEIIPRGTLLISIFASLGKTTLLDIDASVNQAILGLIPAHKLIRDYLKYHLVDVERYISYYSSSNTQENLNLTKIKNLIVLLPPFPEQQSIANYLDRKTHLIDTLIEKKQKLIGLLKGQRAAIINQAVTKGLNPNVKLKDSGIEWLGEIPEGWGVERLKYIASVQFSNVDKKTNENEEKVHLCNYIDVYNNEFITRKIQFMKATALRREIEKFTIKYGDVLATKDSETPSDIANAALVTEDISNVICGYHLAHIRPDRRFLLGVYLFRLFYVKKFNDQFVVSANGITRYGLSTYSFNNAYISLPPINEQKQIVDYLNKITREIDTFIEKQERQIKHLKEYRTALISEVVTGKIDVLDSEIPQVIQS